MSFLNRLFGDGAEKPAELAIEYEGFQIQLTPQAEGVPYRVCGIITNEIDGEIKQHKLIRADLFPSQDEAKSAALRKAKQVIDEQGNGLF